MKIGIQLGLAILAGFIAYMIWNSIDSKIVLTETVELRRNVAKERLTQIGDAQIEYKKIKGTYAASFDALVDFLENDSIVQVKMEGEVPDSLLGKEALALEMGIIKRDTTKIPVREELFKENFRSIVDSMSYIPFTNGKQFTITAGAIEKNKMQVPVFEVKTALTDLYMGLSTDNEGYDMTEFLAIGSMEEPTTNGNWND
ncbi:MAG: hypothetical protein ACPGSL_09200 [Vicingaceae bacterium]